jgi:hypothetical protein
MVFKIGFAVAKILTQQLLRGTMFLLEFSASNAYTQAKHSCCGKTERLELCS